MKKFFEQLLALLRVRFVDVSVEDVQPTTHKDRTLGVLFEGGKGIFQIDLTSNDIHASDLSHYAHNELYKEIERLMRIHRYIESFEVTTHHDILEVSIYYKSPKKLNASAAPPVAQVLQQMKWTRGRSFANLQEGLKELGGDLLRASRTLPTIRSYQPDEGRADLRLLTLRDPHPMETIRLVWVRKDLDVVVLRVDISRGW